MEITENKNPVELSMPAIFADHMVLQRDNEIPIWGMALPNDDIKIQIDNHVKETIVKKDGTWMVHIGPLDAGGPYLLTISGRITGQISFTDVMVGDVWVCAGQSNMAFPLFKDQDGEMESCKADIPEFRQFRCEIPYHVNMKPLQLPTSDWRKCAKPESSQFSAVGYYFGREIYNKERIPIGIIVMALGDLLCESFIDPDFIKKMPKLNILMEEWEQKLAIAKDTYQNKYFPGLFYNGMVKPVIPYAIRGAVWYQGESNALPKRSKRDIFQRTIEYRDLLPALIQNWREAWGIEQLPFYFVQLPNYHDEKMNLHWAELRDAQLHTFKTVSCTGMAVTADIGDSNQLHPTNKKDVGKRLANWALSREYGYDIMPSGPVYREMTIEREKVVLHFDYIDGGLVALDGKPLTEFEIADNRGEFIAANADIVGNNVVVYHPEIKQPIAVRYAWSDDPEISLYNKAGLPASPFRTDNWVLSIES
jgi:sialate O-acetylesterase